MNEEFGIKFVPASVQLLEQRLQHADPGVRTPAAVGIPKLGAPEEPLVELFEKLSEHENWYVQQAVVESAGYTTDHGMGMAVVRQLAPFLDHHTDAVRRHASWSLVNVIHHQHKWVADRDAAEADPAAAEVHIPNGVIGAAELAAKELVARFYSEDKLLRLNAVKAFAKIGFNATPHAVDLGRRIVDPELSVRNETIRAVAALGALVSDAGESLGEGLTHEDPTVRRAAKRALLALSKEAGAAAAAGAAAQLEHEDPIIRVAVADCLAELGHLAAPHGPELASRLEDPDVTVRYTAVHALICGGPDMEPHLKPIKKRSKSEDRDVQRAAIAALRGLACMCPKFARAAQKDLEEEIEVKPRRTALEILAGAAQNVVPYLPDIVACLEEADWAVRRAAIETLCDLKEHASTAAVEVARRLSHHDRNVRRCAAEALGRMGMHAGDYGHRVEALRDTEEDEDVKQTCEEACEMLYAAGMSHGN